MTTRERPTEERPPGGRRWVRRLSIVVAMALVVFALPAIVDAVSLQPGLAIVKTAFEIGPAVTPGPGFAAARKAVTVTRNIDVRVAGAPDARLDVYAPKRPTSATLPIILWVHGGGFISGSKDQVAPYTTMLANAGYVVASLDYTLAPTAKYPVPVDQGNAALGYLVSHAATWGGDSSRVFVGGDSAGAQIASELAAVQTNPALASALDLTPVTTGQTLRGVILFCGLYDMSTVGASGFPAVRTYLWAYTGYRTWTDFPQIRQLSTVDQVTADYPATFLSVGDADPFEHQAFELDAVLRSHGVPLTTEFWNGSGDHLGHEYQFEFTTPQANAAFARTLAFLGERAAE